MAIRHLSTAAALVLITVGCSSSSSSPTAPSAVADRPATALVVERPETTIRLPGVSGPTDVSFPPRNEPLLFRTALEAQYRDVLRRSAVNTFVDQEGTVVWTQEYLRYRVNLCSHAAAVTAVMDQIDGRGIQPTCGTTTTATFPPRNEPFDFMIQLEAKYRDGLRRTASPSFVDVEGNIVWTQEYLRYRVSGCSHETSQLRVFDQIAGRGVGFDCARRTDAFSFTLLAGSTAAFLAGPVRATNGPVVVDLNYTGNFVILGCVGATGAGCQVIGGRPTVRTYNVPRDLPAGPIEVRVYFNSGFAQPAGNANGILSITYNPQ